jgi:TMEM175 potassium channel family protein
MNLAQAQRGLPKSRLEAFSDGVFAIVITLLVLEIKVPALSGPVSDAVLAQALLDGLPVLASCIVSFAVIAIIWVAHHQFVHALRHVDWPLLWLNNLLLLFVIFIPIPTVMIGSYPSLAVPVLVYGVLMTMTGLAFCAPRYYASYVGGLLDLPPEQLRRRMMTTAMAPTFYALGAALAWRLPLLSVAIYVVLPLVYLVRPPGGRA